MKVATICLTCCKAFVYEVGTESDETCPACLKKIADESRYNKELAADWEDKCHDAWADNEDLEASNKDYELQLARQDERVAVLQIENERLNMLLGAAKPGE